MADTSHHLSSNVQQAYVNELAGSQFMTAGMYVRAASRLHVAGDEIPRLTLLLFALELASKAYLVDAGTPEKTLRQANVRHDLKELRALAATAGLHLANPDIIAVIADYRDDHKDRSFRYGGRNYVDLWDPDRALRTISTTVDEIGKLLKAETIESSISGRLLFPHPRCNGALIRPHHVDVDYRGAERGMSHPALD
jgi:hypothetical protein